jgi:hypothetical protein
VRIRLLNKTNELKLNTNFQSKRLVLTRKLNCLFYSRIPEAWRYSKKFEWTKWKYKKPNPSKVEVTLDKGSFKGGTTFLRMQQQQKKHSSHSFFVNERGFNVVLFLVLMLPRLWLSYLSLFMSFPCLPGATIFLWSQTLLRHAHSCW